MSNSNHSAKFINMLIALMASIAIALTCIVPTALAEDGDGTDDNNNGGSTVQPAGPVPNIIITNEVINTVTEDAEMKEYLTDHIMSKMLIGGFTSVTVTSTLLAGFFINLLR